ncbi:unnamed protein product [Peniophora sp. CBMAI 1063]|nr:unnamed protein product [Peniophora sp. CBMAI 1063]
MPSPFYSSLPPPIPIDRMTPLGAPNANQYPARTSQPSSPSYSTGYLASPGGAPRYAYEAPFYAPSHTLAPPSPSYNNFTSAPALPSSSRLSTPSGYGSAAPTTIPTVLSFPTPLMNTSARDASFRVETDRKGHATRVVRADGYEVAHFDWATSLRGLRVRIMGGKELKGREWARLHESDGTRTIRHHGELYFCKPQYGGYTVYQEGSPPAAAWYDERGDYILNAYSETLRTPGLLDICVAAMVLLHSGHSLGDRGQAPPSPSPTSQTQTSKLGKGEGTEGEQSIGAAVRESFFESLGENVGQAIGAAIVAAV